MKTTSTFGAALFALATIAMVTAVSAQESKTPPAAPMMQGQDAMPGNMTGGGMTGMQGMMQMMAPMMAQCTAMMSAMTEQIKSAPNSPNNNG